ncbi:MAG TPA: hypothetical protein VMS86_04845 [Thermoanaerobaculia bacterium]|nr:hypothetical protein [Thermoanaerobaculia bacterium]
MRSLDCKTLTLALALQLAAATAGWAINIYFKDGSDEVTAQSYRIEGDRVIAVLQSGQEIALPLAEVDLERTEAMNKIAKGSAKVLERIEERTTVHSQRTLADLLRERPDDEPAPAQQPAETRTLRRTPAGNVDFFAMPRLPLRGDRGQAILGLLRAKGLRVNDVFQGTTPNRVLIDVVTASRGEAFAALERCAAGFLEIRARFLDIEALELAMATATRSRAGQFVMTPADAERLSGGAVTPAEHFVAHVLF